MQSLEIILEKATRKYDDDEKQKLAQTKNEHYRKLLAELKESAVSDDVRYTLKTLKERGYRIAIGSSSKNAKFILERVGLIGEFDAVSDGNCITKSKPDPEVFVVAADMLGLSAEECIVVEDSVAGIVAAKTGGFTSVAIGDASINASADYNVNKLSDLLDICKKN